MARPAKRMTRKRRVACALALVDYAKMLAVAMSEVESDPPVGAWGHDYTHLVHAHAKKAIKGARNEEFAVDVLFADIVEGLGGDCLDVGHVAFIARALASWTPSLGPHRPGSKAQSSQYLLDIEKLRVEFSR